MSCTSLSPTCRPEAQAAFKEEFTRLDDQISIRFALGRVRVMMGECYFHEAITPENSRAKQHQLSQGDTQLAMADQALEDAHKRAVYALKAKRNRVYNLERTKKYLTENDVQTKLSVWQSYAKCLLQYRDQQRPTPDAADTPGNTAIAVDGRMLETCRKMP